MIDEDHKSELSCAYHTLVEHNLHRRGKCRAESMSPAEIGDAIDTAAGAILDLVGMESEFDMTRRSLSWCERELETQLAISKDLLARLNVERAKVRRLKRRGKRGRI